jgi:hypothetical protein
VRVKHFAGRPPAHVPPWIEASFPREDERLVADIVAALARLLPPGGRLMAVYGQDETERGRSHDEARRRGAAEGPTGSRDRRVAVMSEASGMPLALPSGARLGSGS